MAAWNEILAETTAAGSASDIIRRKHLASLAHHTKRNVIIYYSGWLQKSELARHNQYDFSLNDTDKNGFMATIYKMDRSRGLDLLLHTPGGDMGATESLVDYLRAMFGTDIRAIVPQIAMSAGTMIALSCKEIIMGKHSSLGPIDPQIGGVPAHAVKEEFDRAVREVTATPHIASVWQVVLSKYGPAMIAESAKVIGWADQMVRQWLSTGMFAGDPQATQKIDKVVQELGDHSITLSHSRHISLQAAQSVGLAISALEADPILQDLVLSVQHAAITTFNNTPAIKIIENDRGSAAIQNAQMALTLART